MGWIEKIKRERARNRVTAPTATELNSAPGASWTQNWDPNTGVFTPQAGTLTNPNTRQGTVGSLNGVMITPQSLGQTGPGAPQMGTAGFNQALSDKLSGEDQRPQWAISRAQGDATGRAAAMSALSQMQERSTTGWSQLDRQSLDAAQRQSAQYEQAQRGANMQNMAARGLRGSGMEMLGAMTAQQGGADRSLDAATQLGVAGRDRAMDQTAQAANLGLGIDTQQFGQSMGRAQAVDAMNQWATGKKDDAAAQAFSAATQAAALRMQQNNFLSSSLNGYANTAGSMFRKGGNSSGGGG